MMEMYVKTNFLAVLSFLGYPQEAEKLKRKHLTHTWSTHLYVYSALTRVRTTGRLVPGYPLLLWGPGGSIDCCRSPLVWHYRRLWLKHFCWWVKSGETGKWQLGKQIRQSVSLRPSSFSLCIDPRSLHLEGEVKAKPDMMPMASLLPSSLPVLQMGPSELIQLWMWS